MRRMSYIVILLLSIILILMITNSASLSASVYDGVMLCLRVVVPSLFPFFVICTYMNGMISQCNVKILHPFGRFCRIPYGAESILLIGLLGGYPIGAQCVAQAYENKVLSKADAERMLGFCNNAGPAFIFGMLSIQFPQKHALWLLWSIQIISCLITAHFLPGKNLSTSNVRMDFEQVTLKKSVERSIRAIATVCGWVITFRAIVSAVLHVLIDSPPWLTVLLSGFVELVNGCNALSSLESIRLRFILASALLSFGGICVHMQTASVTSKLRKHMYMKGKLLQTAISTVLSFIVQLVPV